MQSSLGLKAQGNRRVALDNVSVCRARPVKPSGFRLESASHRLFPVLVFSSSRAISKCDRVV